MATSKVYPMRLCLLVMLAVVVPASGGVDAPAARDSVGDPIVRYKQASTFGQKRDALDRLRKSKPRTDADLGALRETFADGNWDEHLFQAAMEAVEGIDDVKLDAGLISILSVEKDCIARFSHADLCGKSEREMLFRDRNVNAIIEKLGLLKSRKAVPVIKEYLDIASTQSAASRALAAVGDKSAVEDIRARAYRGESVQYGGQGLAEARRVVRDLEDKGNRGNWEKIGKQLRGIRNPKAKPDIRRLFSHEDRHVRQQAAIAFMQLCDDGDSEAILEMSKNPDWGVRAFAVEAMKKSNAKAYEDALIGLLVGDSEDVVRLGSADALGRKGVARAVPILERALSDKELRVRDNAFLALVKLTGKKYAYKGQRPVIEREADDILKWNASHPASR